MEWIKFCNNCSGACVEYRANPDGTFTLKNSADPTEATVIYTGHELDEFARGWLEMRGQI